MELTILKGIGEKRVLALNKLDIFSIEDLIAYLPRTYRDLTVISKLNAVAVGENALFKVRVLQKPVTRFPRKNFTVTQCDVEDISGRATVTWFNQGYIAKNIEAGQTVYLYGHIEIKQGRRRLMNPSVEHEDELNILPVYRLPSSCGINQRTMRDIMKQAIEYCATSEKEIFPSSFRAKHSLAERNFATANIHFPQNQSALLQSRRRLCFEELVSIQLYLRQRKISAKNEAGTKFKPYINEIEEFIKNLPYELTNAQLKCLNEIFSDLQSGIAMNRLIQGDVGSGKTIIAVISMYLCSLNGCQSALMAPTEILARQHYDYFVKEFGEEHVSFLSGSLTAAKRREELKRIKDGAVKYIIGTNALIQDKVEYNNLSLIITDEQHRFGVAQRAKLYKKGNSPHTLVMSATPIPRTLSLIVFGDLDISIIDELPKGRQKISTSIISKQREPDMLEYIKKELLSGKQAYFVCPKIEEDEEDPIISAEGLFDLLSNGILKDVDIALIHGKMSNDEKNSAMAQFMSGKIKALISTTVIEVGVNNKNASIMVIYGADRFGLAQLHQLRGRVGRGSIKSYCFLLTNSNSEQTVERLRTLCSTDNGFEIAQKDYELRGPGDYLGKRQSGIAEARFSYALSNTQLLKETQNVIENEIICDSDLYNSLYSAIKDRFNTELSDVVYN